MNNHMGFFKNKRRKKTPTLESWKSAHDPRHGAKFKIQNCVWFVRGSAALAGSMVLF